MSPDEDTTIRRGDKFTTQKTGAHLRALSRIQVFCASESKYKELKNLLVNEGVRIKPSRNAERFSVMSDVISEIKPKDGERLSTKDFLRKKYQALVKERLGNNSLYMEYKRNTANFFGDAPPRSKYGRSPFQL